MSIDREMGRENMVHIYNGILLSHEEEQNCFICRDIDGVKYVRKKKISYINAYMWNLKN